MTKICIFFGAGAEVNFGVSEGKDFAKAVLGIEAGEMNEAMAEYYREKVEKVEKVSTKWYPPYNRNSWELGDLLRASVKKEILEELDDVTPRNTMGEYDKKIEDCVAQLQKSKTEEQNEFIQKYSSYMGILDEKFYTLIQPKVLGPKKFWHVIQCYTRAHLLLTGNILGKFGKCDKDDYKGFLEKPKPTLNAILKVCNDDYSKQESYYQIVRDCVKEDDDISIVNVNYTPICREITKIKEENIAYIQGRMGLYESPRSLCVYDVEKDDLPGDDIWFPFLFLQSGLKPIVECQQIREYAKMLRFLDGLDEDGVIMILGYQMNVDDNHINAMLRHYIVEGKRCIYFDYSGEDLKEQREKILNRLRIKVDPGENNLEVIQIDKSNCLETFKDTIYTCMAPL